MPEPRTKELGITERLRAKYPNDALERLVRSNYDYYSTHGDYVPELASLLLTERAERDALVLVAEAVVNGEWEAARELSEAALESRP